MKKTNYPLASATAIALLASAAVSSAATLTLTDVADLGFGDGVGYTVTTGVTGGGTAASVEADAIELTAGSASTSFVTYTFTGGTVDLTINSTNQTDLESPNNFDGPNAPRTDVNTLFQFDSGNTGISYSAGATHDLASVTTIDQGTDTISITSARGLTGGNASFEANSDWGTFTVTGVSSFTYTISNSATEAVNFDVTAAAVPEPSSTALLGLGGIALILRRRRA